MYKKLPAKLSAGFTLVELLIVIALISILSVAVLATINPIEQSNKAKDSTVQNDAAEVMNAYERYYANSNKYPWMSHGDAATITVETALILRSDAAGFGICGMGVGLTAATAATVGTCSTATTTHLGSLVEADELKASFAGKDEFKTVATTASNGLWTYKAAGSGGSIYVCYVPKAKSNRQITSKLYCLNTTSNTRCLVGETCTGAASPCAAKATTAAGWDIPVFTGLVGMFNCVPN